MSMGPVRCWARSSGQWRCHNGDRGYQQGAVVGEDCQKRLDIVIIKAIRVGKRGDTGGTSCRGGTKHERHPEAPVPQPPSQTLEGLINRPKGYKKLEEGQGLALSAAIQRHGRVEEVFICEWMEKNSRRRICH